jgi:hypothetical protein
MESVMVRHARWLGLAAGLCLAGVSRPVAAAAQAPQDSTARRHQRAIDSLAAALRATQERLDSLVRGAPPPPAAADTLGDLAALRAAAAAAAAPDTATLGQIGSQTGGRSQNALNPEISVTGDVRVGIDRPGPQTSTFVPREVELGLQSALDPYSVAKVFIGYSDEGVDIEEAYAYWTGLPWHFRADVGKFRQQVGELNRWHLHALPEGEYPLVIQRFLGDEGLASTGVSLYWPLPFSGAAGTYEWYGQATRGDNATLFAGGNRPSYLSQLSGFWQLSRATFGQLSVTGIYGTNPDTALTTTVGAVAARFTWRPPERAKYRELTVRAEGFALRRRFAATGATRLGAYVDASWKLSSRVIVGARFDWVEPPAPLSGHEWQIVPTLMFWESEFVYLRAQWTHHRDVFGAASDRIALQVVWAMGPHKHELF